MIRFRVITSVIGVILQSFSGIMIVPLLAAVIACQINSAGAVGLCMLSGMLAARIMASFQTEKGFDDLNRVEGMAVVSLSWLAVATIGSIPYLCFGFRFVDAFFESASGYTATGSTILHDFSLLNSSMFFYRGFTQWLGGMGILVLFVAVLPRLSISGRQLFFAETSAASKEKLTPHIRDTARHLWVWYLVMTMAETTMLVLFGMPLWEAISNSFSTISAAGFSPHPESIMGYQNTRIEWVLIFFMFLAGGNFVLQVKFLKGNFRSFFGNPELRLYAGIIAVATTILFLVLHVNGQGGETTIDTLRISLFQNISIMTSTGAATVNYDLWCDSAKVILVMLMLIGGCSGSAGGGIKVVRFLLLMRYLGKVILKTIYPKAIVHIKLERRIFKESEIQPVLNFVVMYFLLLVFSGTLISIIEDDLTIGYMGAIASLGNVGPGFSAIGPMGNCYNLHWLTKFIFTFLMWAGRLEIMTLAVFLRPETWRDSKW
ncbi:MAG TPA: TrkH family potassium uptake protein [Candidatus Rifleibacterium sp.]|nr:TrkH family potassium uptake protein [Candidatus Rifleibacterium sp.]